MNYSIKLKPATLAARIKCSFALVALAWFTLSSVPNAFGVTPAPDGGYPNNNTAEGTDALISLTSGTDNTAIGFQALSSNTEGYENTATGSFALFNNTTGVFNTATGVLALLSNTIGSDNTATGISALNRNTTGGANTATGAFALVINTTGSFNTANGFEALQANTIGSNNTAEGFRALLNSTGSNNIALGFNAGINLTSGSNNIDIGSLGVAGESNTIRIGKGGTQTATFIAGVHGVTIAEGAAVFIDANGRLGIKHSSARFKEAIKPMDKASEAILALSPVTFRYKKSLIPRASRSLASWPSKWRRSTRI